MVLNLIVQSDVRQLWHRASSSIKHYFRRWRNRNDYDSEDDESIQPFRQSPNSGLKRSSSTPPPPPPVTEYLVPRMGPPIYPLIEQLSGRTQTGGSDCSSCKVECPACAAVASGHSLSNSIHSGRSMANGHASRSRDRSSDRLRKEIENYGWKFPARKWDRK